MNAVDCIDHSKVCRHPSTTNFELFDVEKMYKLLESPFPIFF